MRILFIVPYVPNLIRVRPFNLIRHLSARNHEVTVATLQTGQSDYDDVEALSAFCHRVIALPLPRWRSLLNCIVALPTTEPLQAAFCWQPALVKELDEILWDQSGRPTFDVAHVEHLRGARYGLYLKGLPAAGSREIPVVWDSVDCISFLFEQAMAQSRSPFGRWVTRFDLGRTRPYEGKLANQFNRILITSPADKQALSALVPADKPSPQITILPNGVDLAYFTPGAAAKRESETLVISGKMSYHANITMVLNLAQEIMPRIWAHQPGVKLVVVGKDPPSDLRKLSGDPRIRVTGTVDDVRPYLQQATIAVAPITYGAGIQNKVLEAMACATPVVTSPQAASALTAIPGRDLLVGEGPSDFTEQVLVLLRDQERRQAIGAAGRAYVEVSHNWANIAAQLEEVYAGVIRQVS